MFGGLPEWLPELGAMILIGLVVKWMDDHLDSEFDICRGERTLAARLGRSLFPYGTVLALLALTLNQPLAIALFLSSYALGMMSNWSERLPTRIPPYAESMIAVVLAVVISGWQLELWAFLFIAWVDWLDDLVDYSKDGASGSRNLARRIGVVETSILILLALLASVWLRPDLTLIGFLAVAVVTVISELTTQQLWTENGEEENHDSD